MLEFRTKPTSTITKLILVCVLFVTPFFGSSQNELTDKLRYSKVNSKVYQGTRKMSMDDLFVRMRPYPKTFELIESARDCNFYATIFVTAGAIPLGYVLYDKLLHNNFNWPIFASGLGLVLIAVPINFRYKKQLQRAVISFNEEVDNPRTQSSLSLSFSTSVYGIGLKLNL